MRYAFQTQATSWPLIQQFPFLSVADAIGCWKSVSVHWLDIDKMALLMLKNRYYTFHKLDTELNRWCMAAKENRYEVCDTTLQFYSKMLIHNLDGQCRHFSTRTKLNMW